MTSSIHGRATIPFVPAQQGPSKTIQCALNLTGVLSDPGSFAFVVGKAATQPTLFSHLTSPYTITPSNMDSLSFRPGTGGSAFSAVAQLPGSIFSGMTVGDLIWFCVFDVPAPSGSDPVAAVVTPASALAP